MKKIIQPPYLILFLGLWLVSSCKSILEPQMQGQIALENLFTTEAGMNTALNGVYAPLQGLYKGPMQRLTDLASDDGWTWRNELEPDLFVAEPVFTHSQTVWQSTYQGITRANSVIDNLGLTTFSNPQTKSYTEGQAKFLRAFYYFNLVRLFGGVPLIVKEIKERNDSEVPRASIPEVYTQIKNDLTSAIELLPLTYSGGTSGNEAGRPTKLSAIALKALVHLELEEWDAVIENTDKIIGQRSLAADYASYFNGSAENGTGVLFEVQYGGIDASTTTNMSTFFAPTSTPNGSALILPTDDNLKGKGGGPSSGNGFVQAFENGDTRKAVILSNYGLANFVDASQPVGSLNYVHKYYNTKDPNGRSTWNLPLIRYAEILLAKAEALNEKTYQSNSQAFVLLNQVRTKAGLAALDATQLPSQADFRKALRAERRIELAFETKRYFDLNRWGILESTIQQQLSLLALKFPTARTITHPITNKKQYLYPIPATEFINNARLGNQNPGYN
ncbi:RagB/SusD family nutrient uptake outer membrane protein [Runella sp. MFBS21]|uniref:RagB/SusD family nutrient uptake outer membrane protein n=1 Tax=Runella sp. MFBS21 TaxID=3034018 RepID=UPI0023F8BF1B|nr:RagB/SusD family nutrient uptake outer membrane protein [Runella sp. MFBS21]MDF7815978.1 RagB/SusD family nutrient uptake outer membrane protein [Runella sp. MFBS21]